LFAARAQQDVKRQRLDLEKLKKTHGLEIVRVLELEGVSGTTMLTNEQVQQVLREVAQPGIDGLCCSAIDRLARPQLGAHYAILDGLVIAKKTVWCIDDGELKMGTSDGFDRAISALHRAGIELRKTRQRSLDGKAVRRAEGHHATGTASLPDGLLFNKTSGWSYDTEKYARVAKAYELLFQDIYSLSEIERRVGWGPRGIRTLRNPTWKGIRAYPATEELEAFETTLPLPPMLTPDQWAMAQTLLEKRRPKEPRNPRHLCAGLLQCQCTHLYYIHSDVRRGQHDDYFCGSGHRGKGCGAARLRRLVVDPAITRLVEEHLTDPTVLIAGFRRLKETPQADTRLERERELAKLAARKKRVIDMHEKGDIDEQDYDERIDAIKKAIHEVEARLPVVSAPAPVPDLQDVIKGMVSALARFHKLPFEQQRATLRRLLKPILVVDGAIAEVTLAGAYLGGLAAYTTSRQPLKLLSLHPFPMRDRLR
jgi:DNA invertase Pin-like site-specific DNA recombinase